MQRNGRVHGGHTKNYNSKMEDSRWELSSNQGSATLVCCYASLVHPQVSSALCPLFPSRRRREHYFTLLLFIFLYSLVGWGTTKKSQLAFLFLLLMNHSGTIWQNEPHSPCPNKKWDKSTSKQLKTVVTFSTWVKFLGWIVRVTLSVSQVCMIRISPCLAVMMPAVYLVKQLRSTILMISSENLE